MFLTSKANIIYTYPFSGTESIKFLCLKNWDLIIAEIKRIESVRDFKIATKKWKPTSTAQKMKFSMKDLFSKYDQIRSLLRIWSHLLKKSLMENFIFLNSDHVQSVLFNYHILLNFCFNRRTFSRRVKLLWSHGLAKNQVWTNQNLEILDLNLLL